MKFTHLDGSRPRIGFGPHRHRGGRPNIRRSGKAHERGLTRRKMAIVNFCLAHKSYIAVVTNKKSWSLCPEIDEFAV